MQVVSIHMAVKQRPRHFDTQSNGGNIRLLSGPFQVTALCEVVPDKSELQHEPATSGLLNGRTAPWKLGFMQLQIQEIAWAYFRGAEPNDGCALIDTATRREPQICRDYERESGTVWYEGSKIISDCYGVPDASRLPPWKLELYFGDNPIQDIYSYVLNEKTSRYNYLHEARCSIAFITTLTEQVREGVYKHHRHFLWSALWHVQAASTDPQKTNTTFTMLPGTGFWVSAFKHGGPNNLRYLSALDNPHLTRSCNEAAAEASIVKSTASTWQRFPLMDRKDRIF